MINRKSYFSREREIERIEKQEQKNEGKRRKIIHASHQPLLPVVIQGLFVGMVILLPIVFVVEIIVTLEGKRTAGLIQFLVLSSKSVLYTWLIFGIMVIFLCALQLIRVYHYGYEEYSYKFADEIPEKEFSRYFPVNESKNKEEDELLLYAKPAEVPAEKRYRKLMKNTTAVGAVVLLYYMISFFLQ